MKTVFNPKRTASVIALFVCISVIIIMVVIYQGGMLPGMNESADERAHSIAVRLAKGETVEGVFYDRNHTAVTESHGAGEPASVLYGEAFSYLIGYNDAYYGTSGLRNVLYDDIFFGGKDGVGAEVNLTIDAQLQQFCYKALGEHAGSISVLNAKTGEVLACASRSDDHVGYDANSVRENFAVYNSIPAFWLNHATIANDAPGSTFKLVTASAMLESGCQNYTLPEYATGEYCVGNYTIHNFNGATYAAGSDLRTALIESINTYFASAAVNVLGAGKLDKTARSFLIGEGDIELDFATLRSNFNLGSLSNDALLAQTAYGQGETVMSPMHIAMVMSTILNDGTVMKPYMVDSLRNDGRLRSYSSDEVLCEGVISKETAHAMQDMLSKTAEHYGFESGKLGTCYAKTGTAQVGEINGQDVHHIYIVCGVEAPDGNTYVAVMDWCRTFESSGVLREPMKGLIEFIVNHDFAPNVITETT